MLIKNRVYIIAEAGVNHNGDIALAKELIDVAIKAGVDAVKFQTFKAENIVSVNAPKAVYQAENTNTVESQFDMLKKLELAYPEFLELIDYCNDRNITFLSTPFDDDSIEFLHEAGMCIFKIPSGELTNVPYLRKIGALKKEVILSTGMATLSEIENAISILETAGTERSKVTILHANTEYPTPMQDVNLKAMQTIAEAFKVSVGYSDHTLGIEIPIAAVAMGASVIEKHFTLDKNLEGPDHKASLEPIELINMVAAIRNIESALGNGIKSPSNSEQKNIAIARKSIVAKREIKIGDTFSEDNITIKRPGTGMSPMNWDNLLGTVSIKAYKKDDLI
jgi:N,N'-diacetyllegionaminate synthase